MQNKKHRVYIRDYLERTAIEVYHDGNLDYCETIFNVPSETVDEVVTKFCQNPQYEIRDERIKR